MGFLSVSNLVPWLNFIVNTLSIVTDQFAGSGSSSASSSRFTALGIDVQVTYSGGREGGGQLFEGGDYFKITFLSKGGEHLREAINQGTAIIRRKTVDKFS